jgi:YbbR domain-containing protein
MIVEEDGESASVPIEITYKRNSSSLTINDKNKYLEISLEDLMSRRFMITAATSGSVADGYALGEVSVTNPNVLNVSGPASVVKQIDSVVATIDVEGMSVNLTDNVLPILYDADGNEVDTTRLNLSNTTVTMSAKILNVKEVSLNFSTSGRPYGDYRVVEISSSPEKIKLKGTSAALNPVSSITIPPEVLDVSNAREDITTTIDITEYLPDGVELLDSSDVTITIKVRIEAYESKSIRLAEGDITVEGLTEDYELSYDRATVSVLISGLQKDLNTLTASALHALIDVTGLSEGTHEVTLEVEIDEEKYAYQPVEVQVTIAKKSTDEEEEPDVSDEGDESVDDGADSESEPLQ